MDIIFTDNDKRLICNDCSKFSGLEYITVVKKLCYSCKQCYDCLNEYKEYDDYYLGYVECYGSIWNNETKEYNNFCYDCFNLYKD